MKLVLIRHGQPQTGSDAPQIDPPLTEVGQLQANAVVDAIKPHAPDLIISSGMLRASQTAEPTAKALGMPILEDERFAEIDAGGLPYVDGHIVKARGPKAWKAFLLDPIGSHGVDEAAMRARVLAGTESILETYAGKTVAVFCHTFPIALITAALLGGPGKESLLRYYPAFGSLTRFEGVRMDRMSLMAFGEAQHIQGLGPTV